jgi:hypothetical protein
MAGALKHEIGDREARAPSSTFGRYNPNPYQYQAPPAPFDKTMKGWKVGPLNVGKQLEHSVAFMSGTSPHMKA